MKTTTIIILVLILLIIVSSVCVYFFFKAKIESLSITLFGTKNILEGFKKQEIEYQNTPKSVSSLDQVIKPNILKDFPQINFDELTSMVEDAINTYYLSLEKGKLQNNIYASDNLNNKIITKINELKDKKEEVKNVKIHKTVINSYSNKKGSCIITFQSSLEYLKNNTKEQERLNTDLIYVYDETDVKDMYGVSLNCKNCGGPIKNLGEKTCPYCGTGVVEYTTKVWKVNDIYEK